MSQHDYVIDDQAGLSFLEDLNANLQAIVSNNSGGSEPTVKYPLQWWADTTSDILKLRNEANTAWINVLDLANGAAFLADGAITTAKILNDAVTEAKIADSSVSTAKIQDGAITLAKLAAAIGTVASQAEMEAGTESALRLVSPLRVKQAIAANATQKTPNYGTGVGCAYNATIQAPADGVVIVAASGAFRNGFAVYAGNTNATPNLLATVGDDINNNTKGGSFSFPIKKDAFFKVAPWLTEGFETLTITFYANV